MNKKNQKINDYLLKLSKKIISIDSSNATGTLRLAGFIGNELQKLGFQVDLQQQKFYGASQANLIARWGPKKGRPLFLNTHLDTVATIKKSWTSTGGNPFRAVIKQGKLYGLGSADTKLALACQIAALKSFSFEKMKRPLIVTGTYGEEVGLIGVQKLVPFLKKKKIRPDLILNSEPTHLSPCLGNKGFRVYRISHSFSHQEKKGGYLARLVFSGKSAHSAYPDQGINAILEALRWINRLPRRCRVISIQGGLAPNIIPSFCEVYVLSQVRWVPLSKKFGGKILSIIREKELEYSPRLTLLLRNFLKRYKAYLASLSLRESSNVGCIKGDAKNLEIICDHRYAYRQKRSTFLKRGIFQVEKIKDNPAYSQKSQPQVRRLMTLLRKTGHDVSPIIKPGCTEAGYLGKLGRAVITYGPGKAIGNAHQPNEFVPVSDLFRATKFYRRLIEEWCL